MHSVEAQTWLFTTELDAGLPAFVLKRISLYAQRRIIWLRHLWMTIAQHSKGPSQLHMEVDGYLWQIDNAGDEFKFYRTDDYCLELTHDIDALEKASEKNLAMKRYRQLVQKLRLTACEEDTVQLCFALLHDPDLGRVLAYMHNDSAKPFVTLKLVAQLFGHTAYSNLTAGSPLLGLELIHEHEGGKLEMDAWLGQWLAGYDGLDPLLASVSKFQPAVSPHSSWPLPETADVLNGVVQQGSVSIRVLVTGAIASGRKSFAACLCELLNKQLLVVDATLLQASKQKELYLCALRLSLLTNTIIGWKQLEMQEPFQSQIFL